MENLKGNGQPLVEVQCTLYTLGGTGRIGGTPVMTFILKLPSDMNLHYYTAICHGIGRVWSGDMLIWMIH